MAPSSLREIIHPSNVDQVVVIKRSLHINYKFLKLHYSYEGNPQTTHILIECIPGTVPIMLS